MSIEEPKGNIEKKADLWIRLEAFLVFIIHLYCYPLFYNWSPYVDSTKRLWRIFKTGYADGKEARFEHD